MEYLEIFNPEFDRLSRMMPKCCITQIIKIDDPNASNFDKRLNEITEGDRSENVKEMFHGTKLQNVNSILAVGLQSKYNKISAYGKGTYFSPNISLSLGMYTDSIKEQLSYVFLCEVISKDAKRGSQDIYVCSRNDSFRIKYLIAFYKY